MPNAHDLGTRTYAAISGRSLSTEPSSWTGALGWFVKAAGGNVSAAARLAGVPRRSMRDWLSGVSRPKGPRESALIRSAQLSERRARLRPGREARLRNGTSGGVTIVGSYNYDDDSSGNAKSRTVDIGKFMEPDAVDQLVDAYLSGADEEGLREVFADQITMDPTGFYQRTLALNPQHTHGWTVTRVTL